jgi:transcriptional regulator with XRE-family HTH domain
MKGEIVFPNNIKQLRLQKKMTQAKLGALMNPPVGESTISKMESGERRLSNLQLADLAAILSCRPDELPVVASRDPSSGVLRWEKAQHEAVQHSIQSGAAATGYVLAQLRKKAGKTMQQVANAIGLTLSVYHRVEMASRIIQADEMEAAAKFYGLTSAELIGMFERRTLDNLQELENGVPPERLLPRTPRSLLKEQAKWGRLGALERYAIGRSIRFVAPRRRPTALPVYGKITPYQEGTRRFVIDRDVMVDQVSAEELLAVDDDTFLVRNFSQRLGFLMKPGVLAVVDPQIPVAMGDIAFFTRHDGSADAALVIGDGISPLKLRMYNPDEEISLDHRMIAAVLRIRMLIFI